MLRLSPRGTRFAARAALTISQRGFASSSKWPSVCIIGVGQLGAAVGSNLMRHKVPLTLYDLMGDANVPEALKDSLEGASWAKSAAEAASKSDIVITALPKPEHVTAAFHADQGILEGLRPGATWIEHSTTDFENTLKLKEVVEAKGAKCVEAPLTGGMQLLRAGKMVTLVGAESEVFEGEIASLIALSAPRIVRCGTFGHATIIKLYSNILCAVQDAAVGEALCTAKKAGVDMKLMFDAIRVSSGNSFCWETEVPKALKGDYYPDFTALMMAKDIGLGLELAAKHGVPQPITQHTMDIYQEAIAKYGDECGSTIPVKLLEDAANITLSEGPGNASEAFKDWTYTAEITDGSYQVIGLNVDNPYLREPFTLHADSNTSSTPNTPNEVEEMPDAWMKVMTTSVPSQLQEQFKSWHAEMPELCVKLTGKGNAKIQTFMNGTGSDDGAVLSTTVITFKTKKLMETWDASKEREDWLGRQSEGLNTIVQESKQAA